MKVSYYPGCSLEGTAIEYSESTEAVCHALGIELEELRDWSCCGSSSAHATDHALAVGLAARNLELADKAGRDLVVPCAACYQRLKVADKELRAGKKVDGITNQYKGSFKIRHLADFLWEDAGEKAIAEKVKRPLTGLNPVCYYGCLTSRPPRVTDAKRPEDPQSMDRLLAALGAEVKNWSYKTDCCGGSLILSRPDIARRLIQKLLDMAEEAGADSIVVACPMCHSNLDSRQKEVSQQAGREYKIPIIYISEILGVAFGDPAAKKWLRRHMVDPRPLLTQKGLIHM